MRDGIDGLVRIADRGIAPPGGIVGSRENVADLRQRLVGAEGDIEERGGIAEVAGAPGVGGVGL